MPEQSLSTAQQNIETVAKLEETETELATSKTTVARLPAQDMRERYAEKLGGLQQGFIEQKQVMAEQLNVARVS